MTNEEAKKMLEAKLKCLIAETSGTTHDCNMRLCDGCSLNYEQGNMGEQKQALDMAIKALEQQPSEDAVSREAVLSLQTEYAEKMDATTFWKFRDDIRGLPSVTPTNADTREAYIKGYDYGVKDWFKFKTQPTHGSTYGGVSWGGIYKEEAQPTDKCKGCYYNDDEAHAECVVCDKGAQPSEDCISRSELLRHQHIIYDDDGEDYKAVYVKDIKAMPSVTPERPNPDVVEKMKKAIDEMTEIHSDGEFYIKNVDAKWIINKYLYGAEMSGGGEDENNSGC